MMASSVGCVGLLDREFIAAMKGVREAIKLDSDGMQREAYIQYLSCIQYISHCLVEDAKHKATTGSSMQSQAAQKMLRLVQQCTERSADLFKTIDESQVPAALPRTLSSSGTTVSPPTAQPTTVVTSPSQMLSTPSESHQQPTQPTSTIAKVAAQCAVPPDNLPSVFPPPPSTTVSATSAPASNVKPAYEFPPVPSTSPVHLPSSSPVRVPSGGTSPQAKGHVSPGVTSQSAGSPAGVASPARKHEASPLEVAYRENKKLMAAYQARLARMQSKKNRAAMSLTLQRRLMENMAIAKAREAALAKKIQERQQRLQEEAARRFSTTGEPTVQELELRQVYASTMEFENHVNWLQEWRTKLQKSPCNLQLIHELITLILSCKEHPLTQQLERYQYAVYKLIYPLIQKHSEKIHQNCVPFHNVKPLQLSAGSEPRVIPTDGFVTPDDPSKTIDEDLMKRLHALRESVSLGMRNASSKSYASSTDSISTESTYVDDLEDLLSDDDDVLVDDVIVEEEEGDESCSWGAGEDAHTSANDMSETSPAPAAEEDFDDNSDRDGCSSELNAQSEHVNSTTRICQDASVVNNNNNDDISPDDGDVDKVVETMREELEEAMGEGEQLQHDLEEQIKKDIAIGQGDTATCLRPNQEEEQIKKDIAIEQGDNATCLRPNQEEEQIKTDIDIGQGEDDACLRPNQDAGDDVDRRNSTDSGVQEDRTEGDESSGTHSVISSVKDGVELDVSNDLASDDAIRRDVLKDGEDVKSKVVPDGTDNVDPSGQRTIEYSGENSDARTSDSAGKEDLLDHDSQADGAVTTESKEDGTAKMLQEHGMENRCESDDTRTVKVTEGENSGDVDGGLNETEEERIARLQEEALARHLKTISKDVLTYMDKILSMLVAVYDELDSAGAKEQCISVIEDHFFKIIWQPLLTLYRRVNMRREALAATAMTKYQHAGPEHIGVIKKLSLALPEGAVQNGGANTRYPYWQVVQELRKLTQYYSPLDKLECVVRSSRIIIQCVGDYYEQQGKPRHNSETAIGCDDLLPILSYVIVKSAIPQIVSECSAMEEFIHEGYLFGEEGYCLTTLQTALGYVLKLAND